MAFWTCCSNSLRAFCNSSAASLFRGSSGLGSWKPKRQIIVTKGYEGRNVKENIPKINIASRKQRNLRWARVSSLRGVYLSKHYHRDQYLDDRRPFRTSLWAVRVDSWGLPVIWCNFFMYSTVLFEKSNRKCTHFKTKYKSTASIKPFVGTYYEFEI